MGKKAKRVEFLRPYVTRQLPKILVQRAQILKDICLDGRGPSAQCKEFSSRLREFLEKELKGKKGLNEFCRIASFMVWNSGSESFERELVYNLPAKGPYDRGWTETVFNCVFPKATVEPLKFFYYDATLNSGGEKPIRELGSELIFAGSSKHRPTIVIDLACNPDGLKHRSLAETPNTFEIDLSFDKKTDLAITNRILSFKRSHYDEPKVHNPAIFRNELQNFLKFLHQTYFPAWKTNFSTRKINRIEKKHSIATSALRLVEDSNYSREDLFYTKVINMILYPDARYLYFIPADILQSSPTGGFFFVTTKRVDDIDILRWNQYALMIFGIVAAIPRIEDSLERSTFAHRHLGLIDMIEYAMRKAGPSPRSIIPVTAGLTAIRASFFPDLDSQYEDRLKFGKQLTDRSADGPIQDQFDEYTTLASHLALWRVLRRDGREDGDLRRLIEDYLERDDGIAAFGQYIGLRSPEPELINKNQDTIRRQNYGIMLIQILDQALRHAFLSRYRRLDEDIGVSIALKRTHNNLQLMTTVTNPSSTKLNDPYNLIPRDIREFKRLSSYLRIEECRGPAPSDDLRFWSTSFTMYACDAPGDVVGGDA